MEEVVLRGTTVAKKGSPTKGYSFEIGTVDATIDESILTPELKRALKEIGKRLMQQLECDAICFDKISFQRMWLKHQQKYNAKRCSCGALLDKNGQCTGKY